MKRWRWALLVAGALLLVGSLYLSPLLAARRAGQAAGNSAATKQATERTAQLLQQVAQLQRQGQQQEADIKLLVADALHDQAAAAKSQAQGTAYLIAVDRTLNALCHVEACGAPPLPVSVPTTRPPTTTVHTTTVPPPVKRHGHGKAHK